MDWKRDPYSELGFLLQMVVEGTLAHGTLSTENKLNYVTYIRRFIVNISKKIKRIHKSKNGVCPRPRNYFFLSGKFYTRLLTLLYRPSK